MLNKKRKGATKENQAIADLQEEGYKIAFRSYTMKLGNSGFFRAIDFAHLFDIVAFKGKEWRYISVKGYRMGDMNEHWKTIIQFKNDHGQKASYELWSWHPAKWEGRGKNRVYIKPKWVKYEIRGE